MKILVIGGTGTRGSPRLRRPARGRTSPRAPAPPARHAARQVKVAIGDLIRSEIYPEVIDLNVRFLMRVAKAYRIPRACSFAAS